MRHLTSLTALAAALVLAACGTPGKNVQLEEARANYDVLQSDPHAQGMAAVETKQASDALNAATQAWQHGDDEATVNHLAYLARQRVAIAQQTVSRKVAEQAVENASKERDQIRLTHRTAEAEQARLSAQTAQMQAQAAQNQAQAARDEALTAQQRMQEAQARASQLENQLKDLQAKKTQRGIVVTLGDVLFNTGSSELKSGGMRNLQKLADMMKTNPQMKISVEGFTDSTGSADRNQVLSEQRAQSVRNALVGLGIDGNRIETHGYGPQFPVASNANAAGRQLNRRVEIVISGEGSTIPPR